MISARGLNLCELEIRYSVEAGAGVEIRRSGTAIRIDAGQVLAVGAAEMNLLSKPVPTRLALCLQRAAVCRSKSEPESTALPFGVVTVPATWPVGSGGLQERRTTAVWAHRFR